MYVNDRSRSILLVLAGLLVFSGLAFAVTGAPRDVHRLPGNDEFQSTVEARCTICHTRARVDEARGQQIELDALLQRMIERGAILSERDQKVLGTFWGSPLKEDGAKSSGSE
jgi:ABC-type xylose transport system permease subunit